MCITTYNIFQIMRFQSVVSNKENKHISSQPAFSRLIRCGPNKKGLGTSLITWEQGLIT